MDREELKEVLQEVLAASRAEERERHRIDDERHAKHHEFLDLMIAEKRARVARMERVKTHVIGWGAITALSGLGYTIWIGIRDLILKPHS